MNIKILDSWLRDYLKTKATPKQIAEKLSLTSVSVEKVEKIGKDFIYDVEITTNRPDLMSVVGLAREAAAVLPQFNLETKFLPPKLTKPEKIKENHLITIQNDPKIVNRICAVVMEVNLKNSPSFIQERLETSGIRSLNNLIDVTNYVMREIGHPTHVFDYDRLSTKKLIIRESKKGEKIQTLDEKIHILKGGDIIADNGNGIIEDLLGVMGTANSVVTDKTKRILFFLDNNEPYHIRKTSMNLSIRSEAVILNEKGVDPELAMDAMLRGIELFEEIANGKLLSNIIDIYPNKPREKQIVITKDKIPQIIGITVPEKISVEILEKLGFTIRILKDSLSITVPSWRNNDVEIEEDIVEEIARIYGYHKLPSLLPPFSEIENYHLSQSIFYWEKRIKEAFKYWGFTEIYSYSLVSEDLLEGPVNKAISLANPLTEDLVYLRKTLVPSLLKVIRENENREEIKIFELSNVYHPRANDLPNEILILSGIVKKPKVSLYEVKGIIEALLFDLGIKEQTYKLKKSGGLGAEIYLKNEYLGEIEILDENIIDFELNFEVIKNHATLAKIYKPIAKYPPVIEDVRIKSDEKVSYTQIVSLIKAKSKLVINVTLLDIYKDKRTFRITYLDPEKNLASEDVAKERERIYSALEKEFGVKIA